MSLHSIPRWLSISLRYVLGAVIIYWLLRNQTIEWKQILSLTTPYILFGGGLVLVQLLVSSYRVKLLLHGQGVEVSLAHCVKFNSIGIFYATFLPGGITGDVVRAYFFWREYPKASKTSLAGALFLDRFCGLTTMIFIGLLAASFILTLEGSMQRYVVAGWICLISGVVFYIWMGRYVVFENMESPKGRLASVWFQIRKFFSKIQLKNYALTKICIVLLFSAFIHLSAVFMIYTFSVHVGSGLSLMQVTAVSPVGLLANALPISPGGIGVGEKSFDVLFNLVGGTGGGTTFLITRIFMYSPALIGGFVLLASLFRAHLHDR